MMPRFLSKAPVLAAFLALFCLTGCICKDVDRQLPKPKKYVYSVKVVCDKLHPFENVIHWTDVNVHNPSKTKKTQYLKKFLLVGTQKEPINKQKEVKGVLPPNGAFAVNCDEFHQVLGLGPTEPVIGFVEIISYEPLSVVAVYDKCTLPRRVDYFPNSIMEIELEAADGQTEVVRLEGPTIISKGEVDISDNGTFNIDTEIAHMELKGQSNIFGGEITLTNNANFSSYGQISGKVNPQTGLPVINENSPADSFFSVMVEITPSNARVREMIGSAVNAEPIIAEANITSIPPGAFDEENLIGVPPGRPGPNVYRSSQVSRIYNTKDGGFLGALRGKGHGPNPPNRPPPGHSHPKVICIDASIDVEYVKPTIKEYEKKKKRH